MSGVKWMKFTIYHDLEQLVPKVLFWELAGYAMIKDGKHRDLTAKWSHCVAGSVTSLSTDPARVWQRWLDVEARQAQTSDVINKLFSNSAFQLFNLHTLRVPLSGMQGETMTGVGSGATSVAKNKKEMWGLETMDF